MVNHKELLAGAFVGVGALFLLYKGETATASTMLASLLAFFVGEKNGKRKASTN